MESTTSYTFPVQTGGIFYFPWHRRDQQLLVSHPKDTDIYTISNIESLVFTPNSVPGSVYSRILKLPVIFFLQLPMYLRCAAMRGAPRTSLIVTTLAKLSKQLRNITYRQLFNKHTILSCLFLKIVVYCNKQLCK